TNEYIHVVQTHLAPTGATSRASQTRLFFYPDMPPDHANFRWPHWGGGREPTVREYHVYMRTSNGGDETKPWTLLNVVKPNPPGSEAHLPQPHGVAIDFGKEFRFDGYYSRDNWVAMTTVGIDGREGPLTEPIYMPQAEGALRCAVDAVHEVAYI